MSPEPLLSQSAGAVSTREGETPRQDEVRRRINNLYDRAENDSGTFNATRAAALRGRAGGARSQAPADAALSDLTRQWFNAARTKLGPTVPAPQPVRRTSARTPQPAQPARSVERPAKPLALEASTAVPDAVRELTAGSAPAATAGTFPELTAGSTPELPPGLASPAPAVESQVDESMWRTGAQPVLGDNGTPWHLPESTVAQVPPPPPTAILPTVQDLTAGAHEAGLPVSAAAAYGAGPETAVTATYATGQWADPTASHSAGWPADATTSTYGGGLPAVPASAFPAPEFAAPAFTAPAPAVPAEPAYARAEPVYAGAEPAAATAYAPAASSWAEAPAMPVTATTPGPVAVAPAPAPTLFGGYGAWPDTGHRTKAERVIAFAREQIGRPCVRGAVGPGSYDAPGLAQAAWKAAGVTLPRTAQGQAAAGMPVALAEVQMGDLVFFHDDLGHVGVWTGNGMMIHAPGPGAPIREESVFFAGQAAIKGAIRPA
jgi:cell wall-associated NlpC family hydrolase